MPMIMNEVRAVDQRNLSLGNDKSETLHGSGHGSSVGTIIEPMALHITQDPTVFEGKAPCLTQGYSSPILCSKLIAFVLCPICICIQHITGQR